VAGGWVIELDTATTGEAARPAVPAKVDIFQIDVVDRAVVVLRRPRPTRTVAHG
jgi:hypothetical protein